MTFRVDLAEVERSLGAMERRARALGPVFRELKKPMRDDQRDHQARQEGPDGKWPARAPATMERLRRLRRRGRPLGRLPASTSYAAGNFGVVGRSRVPWSGAHQGGARVGRGAVVPARPFLWLGVELVKRATGRIERAIAEAFGRR